MSLDDSVRHCCGDPDCPNDCEREPVPAGLDTPADRPECPQCGGRGTESRSWDEPERCPGCRGTGLAPADSQPEDEWRESKLALMQTITEQGQRAEAAEAEAQRLTEGLRGRNQLLLSELDWIIGYATTAENEQWGERLTEKLTEFRALLSAVPPVGDCEHDYVFVYGFQSKDDFYRCDKCGAKSDDGVYPKVGSFHPHSGPSDGGGAK